MSSKAGMLTCTLLAVTVTMAVAKSLESPDQDGFHQNQLEPDDASLENALVRYLLTKEWLSRARPPLDITEERQKKRGYWKQCAFNAVSCFGK